MYTHYFDNPDHSEIRGIEDKTKELRMRLANQTKKGYFGIICLRENVSGIMKLKHPRSMEFVMKWVGNDNKSVIFFDTDNGLRNRIKEVLNEYSIWVNVTECNYTTFTNPCTYNPIKSQCEQRIEYHIYEHAYPITEDNPLCPENKTEKCSDCITPSFRQQTNKDSKDMR